MGHGTSGAVGLGVGALGEFRRYLANLSRQTRHRAAIPSDGALGRFRARVDSSARLYLQRMNAAGAAGRRVDLYC